jgi:hypothetical protein
MILDELRTQVTMAATAFVQGDPQPVKRFVLEADDVPLAEINNIANCAAPSEAIGAMGIGRKC